MHNLLSIDQTEQSRKFTPRSLLRSLWRYLGLLLVAYFVLRIGLFFITLPEPEAAAAAVYEPTFILTDDRIWAGKAFVAQIPGCDAPAIVSAGHLFGPAGGYSVQLTPAQIAEKTLRIELTAITDQTVNSHAARSLTPPQNAGDMVAFATPGEFVGASLPLAERLPQAGHRVWIVTEIYNGNPAVAHQARVWGTQDGEIYYGLADPDYSGQATSGAPVINSLGEVIAINMGGGENADGELFGYGNPVTTWGPLLSQQCEMQVSADGAD